ncbi:hypothetical protein ACIQ2D_02805 [Lysinibacillus sp. NPDC097287]|uniref:hypothetical protein n=1 Tax=Lysinibacillus sp. NPDC097287 TaxID=3364144 RepID=UPI0038087DFD
MTSTSFNPIQMQQTAAVPSNQPLALKQGQVFNGTITKLYPDQMAEVQVGNQKMIAKLEVPLKAGDAHFFQVTGTSPQTELKVVTGPMAQSTSPTQQMNQLLESMNLPKTTEMQEVLSHFMKAQIPISKEQLVQAEAWMKTLPEGISKTDALQVMQKMVELKMPFTNDVFQALVSGQKTVGMSSTMNNFAQLLMQDKALPEGIKQNLMQQVQAIAKPFDAETGGLVLAKSVQILNNNAASISDRLQALNMLKEAGVLPQNATLQNWSSIQSTPTQQTQMQPPQMQQSGQIVQTILATKPENTAQLVEQLKSWTTGQNLLTNEQKQQFTQLIERFSQLPPSKQTLEVFAKQVQEQLIKAFTQNIPERLFTQDSNGLSAKDHLLSLLKPETATIAQNEALMRNLVKVGGESPQPVIQQMMTQADAQVQSSMDSKAMEHALKTVLKGLGISYEAALNNKSADLQAIAHQLKPQLHTLLQDAQITPQLKEAAEMLMTRMNGMQLSSGENGHQHQLIMQVPLEFFGKKMDATLQWNGRMKDDGKIDANYARVLFYLQMESMKETVIDMQVQNRVVTVTVFNENPDVVPLAEPLKAALKTGLAEKDYQLSAVFIKPFEKTSPVKETIKTELQEEHSGVDFRV